MKTFLHFLSYASEHPQLSKHVHIKVNLCSVTVLDTHTVINTEFFYLGLGIHSITLAGNVIYSIPIWHSLP